jgi:DUF4097 and DUF4098 domain-containing protein YvlB
LNLLLAALLGLPAATTDDFHWKGKLAEGRTIEIKGVNGDVAAERATGSEVEVVARKHGRRSDAASVEVKVVEHEGGVTICAVYPSSDDRPNECLPGDKGRMNTRNNDVEVDFTVRVPAGVRFVGRTVNGGIDAIGLPSDAEAYTVNGSVKVTAAGLARAEAVNGSLRAALGKADWTRPLAFRTVNGEIHVTLPASVGADVKAETVNGEISTDFPLTVQGKIGRHKLNGSIGGGGRSLTLQTVNGSIHIERAP